MITLLAPLLLLAASVEDVVLNISPDQPLRHVYVDEPLVIEFISPTDVTFSATLIVEHEGQEVQALDLGEIRLFAKAPHWEALPQVTRDKGVFELRVQISASGATAARSASFCRIDRPFRGDFASPTVALPPGASALVTALRSLPAYTLEVDPAQPEARDTIAKAAADGFALTLSLDPSGTAFDVLEVENIAKDTRAHVTRWEVDVAGDPDRFIRFAQAARRGARRAAIAAAVESVEEFESLLLLRAGLFFDHVSVTQTGPERASLDAYRAAAYSAGYEGLQFHERGAATAEYASAGITPVQRYIENLAEGFAGSTLKGAWLFSENIFTPAYCELSACIHQLGRTTYVGPLSGDPDLRGFLFRNERDSTQTWVAAFWSLSETKEHRLSLDNVIDAIVSNRYNNDTGPVQRSDGAAVFIAEGTLQFVRGEGGSLIAQAAENRLKAESTRILADESLTAALTAELRQALEAFASEAAPTSRRADFWTVLRVFPDLEGRWHDGSLPRGVAVGLMARLSALARTAAILEQEMGAPFLEPLHETLARTGEYQSLYLTGTGGLATNRERGDWLLDEVTRLIEEAKRLSGIERKTEAHAVAALAEWRARALRYTFKAKALGGPDPFESPAAPEEEEAAAEENGDES